MEYHRFAKFWCYQLPIRQLEVWEVIYEFKIVEFPAAAVLVILEVITLVRRSVIVS